MAKKDAYYFSHDSNAQDDPKCMVLIDQLGMEGYGIFWALIEKLRAEKDYTLPLIVSGSFAKRWGTSKEKVDTVIKNYGLFIIENDTFFSLRLKSSMEQKSAAGRASAISRWSKNTPQLMQSHANVLPMHANALPTHTSAMQNDANKGKEKKEKESKVDKKDKHLDCVFLTTNEFDSLIVKHGKLKTDWVIEKLNNYKMAHNKTYKSDYGAINSWVLDEYELKHSKSPISVTHYSPPKIASK